MATTPNYGWVTPAPTDFVTDLPADFETFADAADATVKALNPGTTAGDIDYYTSSTAKARLGIGSAGQVLKVNSGATAPEWGVIATSPEWSLVNSGGTALTGAATITVTGITKGNIFILVSGASSATTDSLISFTFNSDTSSKYAWLGGTISGTSAYSASIVNAVNQTVDAQTSIAWSQLSGNAGSAGSGYLSVLGAIGSTPKMYQYASGATRSTSSGHTNYTGAGVYTGTSSITSVSIISSVGDFDAGTIYVYEA